MGIHNLRKMEGLALFVTCGDGMNEFVEEELKSVFGGDVCVILSIRGKVFFSLALSGDPAPLFSLRTIERLFVWACRVPKQASVPYNQSWVMSAVTQLVLDQAKPDLPANRRSWANVLSDYCHAHGHRPAANLHHIAYKHSFAIHHTGTSCVCGRNQNSIRSSGDVRDGSILEYAIDHVMFRVSARLRGSARKPKAPLNATEQSRGHEEVTSWIAHAIQQATMSDPHAWRYAADMFHLEVVVHINDDGMVCGVALTPQSVSSQQALPGGGLRGTTAQAIASLVLRHLDEANQEEAPLVILDPMCGRGALLVALYQTFSLPLARGE
eukprot:c14055_g1_i2.p1 GENE.c14055_g1_i2~~c14055_g1_i2.p1  ORF type:complete len:325 (-),score=65.70 c14055_g1_i2:810-1784(-)